MNDVNLIIFLDKTKVLMKNYLPYLVIAILSILFYRQCTLPSPAPQIIIKEKIIKIPEIKKQFD